MKSLVPLFIVCSLLAFACQTQGDPEGRTIEQCANACWLIGGANCGDVGEECIDRCVRIDLPPAMECPVEQQRYTDCYWQAESYTCDAELRTVPTGCDEELNAGRACLGLDDAGTTDAAATTDASARNATLPLDATSDH